MTLCVTIATNLTDGLLINYTRIGSAFNKLSENIYFYILTLLIMAVVFDFLRAITEYWFRIKNGISWGTFWFQIGEYERVNGFYHIFIYKIIFIKSNIGDPTLEIWLKNEANVDG